MGALALAGRGIASVIAATVIWATGKVVADVAGTITATSGLGQDRKGLAAGLLTTAQELGAACGLGVVAAVVAARTDAVGATATGAEPAVEALQWGLLAGVAFVALALVVVLAGLRHSTEPPGHEPPCGPHSQRRRLSTCAGRDPPGRLRSPTRGLDSDQARDAGADRTADRP